MQAYFKILKNSLYMNKLIVSTGYLILAVIAMFWLKTPVEKVVATYIVLDILMIFVVNGILTHYQTTYLKRNQDIGYFILKEGISYASIALITYLSMMLASTYDTNSMPFNSFIILIITGLTIFSLFDLERHRKLYTPLITKQNREMDDFKQKYLFNNDDDLLLEYACVYDYNFKLKSIEKNGIKVEDEYIYMDNIKYKRKHYLRYMKENEISTLEDLTEEDKLLIAMINIS